MGSRSVVPLELVRRGTTKGSKVNSSCGIPKAEVVGNKDIEGNGRRGLGDGIGMGGGTTVVVGDGHKIRTCG